MLRTGCMGGMGDTSSPVGELQRYRIRAGVYVRKLVVRRRLRLFPAYLPFPFVNGRTAAGALPISVLICRGLREDAKSGPLTPRPRHSVLSGVCPAVVRVTKCYPFGELQSKVRYGIRPRQS